jgi:hypothetical protein
LFTERNENKNENKNGRIFIDNFILLSPHENQWYYRKGGCAPVSFINDISYYSFIPGGWRKITPPVYRYQKQMAVCIPDNIGWQFCVFLYPLYAE